MEEKTKETIGRRRLPVYMNKEENSKGQSQRMIQDYFEYSKRTQENQLQKDLNAQVRTIDSFTSSNLVEKLRDGSEGTKDLQRTKGGRVEVINNKRQIAAQYIELKVCLQNVRGWNSKLKQDQMMKEIEDKNPDFIALVETRLQRIFGNNSQNITRTQLARNAGILTLNSGKYQMKSIKTLKQYVTWKILNVEDYPIHIITVYIPPYQNDEVKELQNRIIYIIKSIRQKCDRQKLIVMGDFNFHIKELSKRLRKEGLRESIPEGLKTYSRGNQLDQIFSNAETIEWELDQVKLTDHKLLQAKLKIKFHENDLKMTDREKIIRISDVRKQCWKTFIEEGRELKQEELEQPVRKCFEDKLEKQSKTKNWYQQPPQLAVRNNITSNNSIYLDTKEQWKEAIRDMEHCLGRNDLKGFFYLVKRLTKKKEISSTNQRIDNQRRKSTNRRTDTESGFRILQPTLQR